MARIIRAACHPTDRLADHFQSVSLSQEGRQSQKKTPHVNFAGSRSGNGHTDHWTDTDSVVGTQRVESVCSTDKQSAVLAEQNLDEITALPLKAKTQRRRKENHKVSSERRAVVNQSCTRVKDISPSEVLRRKALKSNPQGK